MQRKTKNKSDRVLVQLRIKRELAAAIKAKAAEKDLPVSQWIRQLCIAAIHAPAS